MLWGESKLIGCGRATFKKSDLGLCLLLVCNYAVGVQEGKTIFPLDTIACQKCSCSKPYSNLCVNQLNPKSFSPPFRMAALPPCDGGKNHGGEKCLMEIFEIFISYLSLYLL